MADASPDTPMDPREALFHKAYETVKPAVADYHGASAFIIADRTIDTLIDAGLLSLSERDTREGSGPPRGEASGTPAEPLGYVVLEQDKDGKRYLDHAVLHDTANEASFWASFRDRETGEPHTVHAVSPEPTPGHTDSKEA